MNPLRHLAHKPWENKGVIGGGDPLSPKGAFATAPERVALVVFFMVVAVLFSLFTVGYVMRMELPDWRPLAEPAQLWLSTALLVGGSLCLHRASRLVKGDSAAGVASYFAAGGVFAALFIASQLAVWNTLQQAGAFLSANPANAFFYLLTGVHAAHVLGGLWVWSRTLIRLGSGAELADVRLSIELCAWYWHFLFAVWLALFALLAST